MVARVVFLTALLLLNRGTLPAAVSVPEGALHGFPVLRDLQGKKLADGDFSQWKENDRLYIRITYEFGDGRRTVETAVFREKPLAQEGWSFTEEKEKEPYRQFEVDFISGKATARKLDHGEMKSWTRTLELRPGRTFIGFGFVLAILGMRAGLIDGKPEELQTVGFLPKPRAGTVQVSHGGVDELRMADRTLKADRFVIHPRLSWLADLFVDLPDGRIWLTHQTPAGFLRSEAPLAEPRDPMVRVDLLPGGQSTPAKPVEGQLPRP